MIFDEEKKALLPNLSIYAPDEVCYNYVIFFSYAPFMRSILVIC